MVEYIHWNGNRWTRKAAFQSALCRHDSFVWRGKLKSLEDDVVAFFPYDDCGVLRANVDWKRPAWSSRLGQKLREYDARGWLTIIWQLDKCIEKQLLLDMTIIVRD